MLTDKRITRLPGFLYLLNAVTGAVSIIYIKGGKGAGGKGAVFEKKICGACFATHHQKVGEPGTFRRLDDGMVQEPHRGQDRDRGLANSLQSRSTAFELAVQNPGAIPPGQ